MRELKFRAWVTNQNRMTYATVDDIGSKWSAPVTRWGVVMQYTGLKDKNGREIFESDILETVYQYNDKRQVRRMKVEVDTVNPCMVLVNVRNKNDVEYDFVQCGLMSHTILGNIHENPELLGDAK